MEKNVGEMTLSQCRKYDFVPEYFKRLENCSALVFGEWEDEEREILRGMVIAIPDAFDPKCAVIRFTWVREGEKRANILMRIMVSSTGRFRSRGINNLFYREERMAADGDGEFLKLLKASGALSAQKLGTNTHIWYVSDLYDSKFAGIRPQKLQGKAEVVSFRDYSPEKRKILLKKTGVSSKDAYMNVAFEGPYNMFFMTDEGPVAAMTVEQPLPDKFVINPICYDKKKTTKAAMMVLIKEVLDTALIGQTMDARIFVRTRDEEELKLISQIIGDPAYEAKSVGYIGTIKTYLDKKGIDNA